MTTDTDRLRTAGLRATRPRLAVLAALRDLGGHRTADEILEHIPPGPGAPRRATVYNALRDLTGAGLVLTADAGPGAGLYEVGDTFHHHFVCRDCGRVIDIPCVTGTRPCLRPDEDPPPDVGDIDEAQIIFRGRCRACASRATRATRATRPARATADVS